VHRLEGERLEDEHFQGALEQLGMFVGHGALLQMI
jgi:hypothetical protein